MKLTRLRQAVEQIAFAEDKKQQMIRELKKGKTPSRSYGYVWRIAAIFSLCILAVCILSVPARALVSSLVRERMEQTPQEDREMLTEQVDMQNVDIDGYTRPYTEAEKARMEELYEQYQNGTFPAGEILQVDSEEEAKAQEFCFLTTASVFYLPADRELTDEEILQKIDFEYKRNYALEERHKEEKAVKKAAEQEQIQQAVEAGGVTEEQAVEIAEEYLTKIYGVDGSGLELNHYYDEEAAEMIMGQPAYCVNWSDIINHRFYYFWIGVADGSLLGATYTGNEISEQLEAAKPAIEEAPDRIAQVKQAAQRFLTDTMGIQESYAKIRSCYQITSAGDISKFVDILFVKADGKAIVLECGWDGTVNNYEAVAEEDYENRKERTREVMTMRYTEEYGREVTMENVWGE